jgi:hypothetical protein
MEDGTVVQVSGDPELERRIAYLATNLFSPAVEVESHAAHVEPPGYDDSEFIEAAYLDAEFDIPESYAETPVQEVNPRLMPLEPGVEAPEPNPSWPLVRLVFSDGSEAALPRDQEILDRVAYVVTNLLPDRPVA